MKTVSSFRSRVRIAALLTAWFIGLGAGRAQSPGAQLPPEQGAVSV